MPVPANISDLSTTAGSNPPTGSETPQEGDNHLRAAYSFIRQLSNRLDGTTQSDSPTFVDVTASGNVTASSSASSTAPRFRFSGDTDTGIGRSAADTVDIITAGTSKVTITSDGRLYGIALHNNAGAVTGATNQFIASGTYTPTLTAVLNIDSTTARKCQWMRVGNVVTVSGQLDVDPTAASLTDVGVSLPIASSLGTVFECCGVANVQSSAEGTGGLIFGDAANNRATLRFTAASTASSTWCFTFTYEVV